MGVLDTGINNSVIAYYREILPITGENIEYMNLYENVENENLKKLFSLLHFHYIRLFKSMNGRLPTKEHHAHFWADPSRELISVIDVTTGLQRALKNSEYSFNIIKEYEERIALCTEFLDNSGGSSIPPYTEKIELFYGIPIFSLSASISAHTTIKNRYALKLIGAGSYAQVFKYLDDYYQKEFVVKRAKENLNDKELSRFKQEFDIMNKFLSPYTNPY